jgi:hypothetical protein
MSNNSSAMPEDIFGENFVVPPHSVGKKIIDSLRNSFTGNGKMQRGDFYMDQTRVLLQQHFHIINVKEQDIIMDKYTESVRTLNHRHLLKCGTTGQLSQEEEQKPATLLKDISRP